MQGSINSEEHYTRQDNFNYTWLCQALLQNISLSTDMQQ